MKAAVITGSAAAKEFAVRQVPPPSPGPDDLLVAVRASALNQADLRQAASHFAASEERPGVAIGGLELAGYVIDIGANVRTFAVGDRIMAMAGAAWAEQAVVDHRLAMPVPPAFSWAEAAATPVSFLTAHDALARAASFRPGHAVLVQGATSAAGLACVQMARHLGASRVFGTTGSPTKMQSLHAVGCDIPVCRADADVAKVVAAATDGRGVDVVIDIVGGAVVEENVNSARIGGVIVCLGRLAGREASIDLDEFSRKRITMIGVTFRTRTLEERAAAVERFNQDAIPALAAGELRPVIDRTFALDDVQAAYEYLKQSDRMGKILLTVRDQ